MNAQAISSRDGTAISAALLGIGLDYDRADAARTHLAGYGLPVNIVAPQVGTIDEAHQRGGWEPVASVSNLVCRAIDGEMQVAYLVPAIPAQTDCGHGHLDECEHCGAANRDLYDSAI